MRDAPMSEVFRVSLASAKIAVLLSELPNDDKLIVDRKLLETITKFVSNRIILSANDEAHFDILADTEEEGLKILENLRNDIDQTIRLLQTPNMHGA